MEYKLQTRWSSNVWPAGSIVSISQESLERSWIASGQHIGSMTDLLAVIYGLTRGDAAHVVEDFFFEQSGVEDGLL